jgi:hypothetical protein
MIMNNRLRPLSLATVALLLLLLPVPTPRAATETRYVSDQLLLEVRAAPDPAAAAEATLPTGTPVEVLEQRDGMARIHAADGTEGWVDSAFLMGEQPARLRLLTTEDRLQKAREEIDRLREDNERLQTRDGPSPPAGDGDARLQVENAALRARIERAAAVLRGEESPGAAAPGGTGPAVIPTLAWLGLALGSLLAGFLLGTRWMDRRQRRRLGGFRL